MSSEFKIAGAQIDIALGDNQSNVARMVKLIEETAKQGAALTVFPEAAVTGYCFRSLDEARPQAERIDGPSVSALIDACRESNSHAIFGLLEEDGDEIYNALALVGPEGLVGSYRKLHLPYLGIDRFVTPGNRPFEVHDIGGLRVGMNICYDGGFPESARIMALAGADLVVLPTNWPPGAETAAQYLTNARALENNIYFMAVNRIGTERGFTFIGHSRIADTNGVTMATADHVEEAVLYADIDVEKARNKRLVRVRDQHVIDRVGDRRPDMYGPLLDPPANSTPRHDIEAATHITE